MSLSTLFSPNTYNINSKSHTLNNLPSNPTNLSNTIWSNNAHNPPHLMFGSTDLSNGGGGGGDKGEKGDKGEAGTNGLKGDIGSNGLKGDIGSNGLKGDPGSGDKGLKGDAGLDGLKGDIGSNGLKGDPGSGDKGLKGDAGINGLKGETGSGDKGLKGDTGTNGLKGNLGDKGLKGDVGSAVVLSSGIWTPTVSFTQIFTSVSPTTSIYSRIGNIVTFSICTNATIPANMAQGIIYFSIPVASGDFNGNNVIGTASITGASTGVVQYGIVTATAATPEIVLSMKIQASTSITVLIYITGQYFIPPG
ncbi:collagen-like protein [Zamilon virus]|uniref:Collagen-like protein n=1 Tax=Zamilon virus TaxID=1411887 RepID=V6BPN7_9VIRU|nr:collagen-like protein [Zamilon virus]CDI70058.1 collagen-like protein [Zamilon virus]